MTMSMVGPGLTTTSYKKRKQTKRTKNQQLAFELRHREYNKSMKRMGCHNQMMSLEDYDLYVRGLYKPAAKKREVYKPAVPAYRRDTPNIPSLGNGVGVAPVKEQMKYSGERQLLGIATMHKSNMVPVFADQKEQAKEIASMRR
jgi:hypothetical protein